jgi:DNA ligase-1
LKTFADAIEAAEKVSTHVEKHEALAGIQKHQQRLIHEALNKYRKFHVKHWNDPSKFSDKDYPTLIPFYNTLDRLANRQVTGNDARDLVTKTLRMYTARTAKYLTRVLRKDLDCGADAKTFRKIYPEVEIPEFELMKAKKMESDYRWVFPCIIEAKYDGERILACVNLDEKSVKYYSRSGRSKDYYCKGLFDKELLAWAAEVGEDIIVDGEVLGESFQATMQAKGKKNGVQKAALRFYAFDWMTLANWSVKSCLNTQMVRTQALHEHLQNGTLVVPSETRWVKSKEEVMAFYKTMFEKDGTLRKGRDGLIIKYPEAFYEWERSSSWTKLKPTYPVDLKVMKVYLGKGKHSRTMGTMDCVGTDESGRRIEVAVGGGFKDEQRDWFLKNAKKIEGKLFIEVEHYGLSQSKNSSIFSLRHPQFLKIREDK